MDATRQVLHDLVERIPETEVPIAERFLSFLSNERVGPEFAQSIRKGIAQAEAGETTVCYNYGEMVEKLLDKA